MSLSLIILISVGTGFFLLTLIYLLLNRKSISRMHGMMAAMTIGMMVGILGGTILGSTFPDHLFLSTILGIGLSSGLIVVFEYYCTIPGHKESGMIGTIDIL